VEARWPARVHPILRWRPNSAGPSDLGVTIYDQNLKKEAVFWPVNTFAVLFAQAIQYYQHRVDTIRQLEEKLSYLGGQVFTYFNGFVFGSISCHINIDPTP
jgi:hypothetical protein